MKQSLYQKYIKRLIDIILSACGLIVLSPVFIVLAMGKHLLLWTRFAWCTFLNVVRRNEGMAKIIHFCWFGNNPKSAVIEKCINSWKSFFPDWEIKEWNESNVDVNCNLYVRQAYESGKYAFVSDFVRFMVLEEYGGLYFDTDVEVVKNFAPLLEDLAFAGFETDEFVAPGLVLYAKQPGNPIIKEARAWYEQHGLMIMNHVYLILYFLKKAISPPKFRLKRE